MSSTPLVRRWQPSDRGPLRIPVAFLTGRSGNIIGSVSGTNFAIPLTCNSVSTERNVCHGDSIERNVRTRSFLSFIVVSLLVRATVTVTIGSGKYKQEPVFAVVFIASLQRIRNMLILCFRIPDLSQVDTQTHDSELSLCPDRAWATVIPLTGLDGFVIVSWILTLLGTETDLALGFVRSRPHLRGH
jgi:hypothetical protein